MDDAQSYAVLLFPQALEALGDAIKPYLATGPLGPHVVCAEIDVSGAYCQMTLQGKNADGQAVELDMMVPHAMVKLIMSLRDDHPFGFQAKPG
jgi:hypothetical protein